MLASSQETWTHVQCKNEDDFPADALSTKTLHRWLPQCCHDIWISRPDLLPLIVNVAIVIRAEVERVTHSLHFNATEPVKRIATRCIANHQTAESDHIFHDELAQEIQDAIRVEFPLGDRAGMDHGIRTNVQEGRDNEGNSGLESNSNGHTYRYGLQSPFMSLTGLLSHLPNAVLGAFPGRNDLLFAIGRVMESRLQHVGSDYVQKLQVAAEACLKQYSDTTMNVERLGDLVCIAIVREAEAINLQYLSSIYRRRKPSRSVSKGDE